MPSNKELLAEKSDVSVVITIDSNHTSAALLTAPTKGSRKGGPIWDNENKFGFNKRTVKVCISCSWQCPRTSAPSAPHQTVSLYLRVVLQKCTRRGWGPLKGARSAKKTFMGLRSRLVSCWRNGREECFSVKGPFIFFFTYLPPNIWLLTPYMSLLLST